MVATAWYTGWHSEYLPVANVSWDKYTHMTYAFALTAPSTGEVSLTDSDPNVLPVFVSTAHENGVKALISVGGWSGSRSFSDNVATEENRTAFVQTITNFIQNYSLDGVDFDWEYPNADGIGCNAQSPDDATNFLSFLQALRADPVGSNLTLTASTSLTPWKGPNGTALTDVSGFADVLDWIHIMNYDVWGTWDTAVGPNAPLNDTCASQQDQQGSAVSAVAAWTAAGMPAHQLVLGVASYGHSFQVEASNAFDCDGQAPAAYPAFTSTQPAGDSWDAASNTDVCGVTSGYTGVFQFRGLVGEGWLYPNGSVVEGIDYRFDECSQTPYVYNETSLVMVSFDDAASFAAKGDYIKSTNLRGFAMWEAAGDYNDILLDSIREAAGFDGGC
ncbi:chitinase [Sparassis latifolia]